MPGLHQFTEKSAAGKNLVTSAEAAPQAIAGESAASLSSGEGTGPAPDLGGRLHALLSASAARGLVANASYLLGTQGLTSGVGFLYWAVAARKLTSTALGSVAVTVSLMAFLASIGSLGLTIGVVRYRPADGAGMLARGAVALTVSGGVLVAITVALLQRAGGLPSLSALAMNSWWLVAAVPIVAVGAMTDALALAERDTRWVLARNGVAGVGRLILLAAVVTTAAAAIGTTVLCIAASTVVIAAAVPALATRLLPGKMLVSWSFIRYSVGQYVVNWALTTPQYLFPVLVSATLGVGLAGYFSIAWLAAYMLSAVGDSAGASLMAEGSADPRRLSALHTRVTRTMGGLLLIGVALAVASAPLLPVAFGAGFTPADVAVFQLLTLGAVPYFVAATTIYRFRVVGGARQALAIALVCGPLSCVGIIVLTPWLGLIGVGWAYIVANSGAALIAAALLRWDARSRPKIQTV